MSCPEEPTTTLWLLFIIKQYVLSACKVQSTVQVLMRHTQRLEKVSERKNFPFSKQLGAYSNFHY